MNLFTDDDRVSSSTVNIYSQPNNMNRQPNNMNDDRASSFTDDPRMTSYNFDNMNQQPVRDKLSQKDYDLLQASLKKMAAAEKTRQNNQ